MSSSFAARGDDRESLATASLPSASPGADSRPSSATSSSVSSPRFQAIELCPPIPSSAPSTPDLETRIVAFLNVRHAAQARMPARPQTSPGASAQAEGIARLDALWAQGAVQRERSLGAGSRLKRVESAGPARPTMAVEMIRRMSSNGRAIVMPDGQSITFSPKPRTVQPTA